MKEYTVQSKPTDEELFNNPTWADEMTPEDWDYLITNYCPNIKLIRVRPKDAIEVLAEVNGATIFKVKEEVYALLSKEYCPSIEAAPVWPGESCLDQVAVDKDYGEATKFGLHLLQKGRTYILHKENEKLYEVENDEELNRIKELADQINSASAELDIYLDYPHYS